MTCAGGTTADKCTSCVVTKAFNSTGGACVAGVTDCKDGKHVYGTPVTCNECKDATYVPNTDKSACKSCASINTNLKCETTTYDATNTACSCSKCINTALDYTFYLSATAPYSCVDTAIS